MRFQIVCRPASVVFVFCVLLCQQSFSQKTPAKDTPDREAVLRKKLKERSQEIVEAFKFYQRDDNEQTEVDVVQEPILSHNDAERGELGGIWLVGDKGRPLAVANAWTKLDSSSWVCSVRSLSPESNVGGVLYDALHPWMPNSPGVKFAPIPGADMPSSVSSVRFSQLKKHARRFGGHEFWQGGRHELRLLVRELHRYKDPENGIVDGALFSIAHGTNTECFLMIEVQEKDGEQGWYYGLGRFGFAELHINVDKKEVWSEPAVGAEGKTAGFRDPYYLFNLRRAIR